MPILVVLIQILEIIQNLSSTWRQSLNEIGGHGHCASNEPMCCDFEWISTPYIGKKSEWVMREFESYKKFHLYIDSCDLTSNGWHNKFIFLLCSQIGTNFSIFDFIHYKPTKLGVQMNPKEAS